MAFEISSESRARAIEASRRRARPSLRAHCDALLALLRDHDAQAPVLADRSNLLGEQVARALSWLIIQGVVERRSREVVPGALGGPPAWVYGLAGREPRPLLQRVARTHTTRALSRAPRQLHNAQRVPRRNARGSGVVAPAPYHRGARWDAGY